MVDGATGAGEPARRPRAQRREGERLRAAVLDPEQYRVLFMDKTARVVAEAGGGRQASVSGFHHLLENVQRAIDTDAIKHDDIQVIATALWCMVHGITALAISLPAFPRGTSLNELVSHVFHAYATGVGPLG